MRDEFVLVKSEDELRPGMCVELRPCAKTGRRVRMIWLGRELSVTRCPDCGKCRGWETTDGILCKVMTCIRERRLWRLRDDDTAADETATSKRKERVR